MTVTEDPAGQAPERPERVSAGRRRAAGIYGAIITASIITAVGSSLPTLTLALSVLVTLVVYWLAEEYAEVLGRQATGGHVPTWAYIRGRLASSWPIVSASFAPLAVLVVARAAGASAFVAASVAAGAAIVLLTAHGWTAGRAARLKGWQLTASTSIAAALGLVMIALKNLVILHLH